MLRWKEKNHLQHIEKVSHLFRRIGPIGCSCTAVRWCFAVVTSRSMCYLDRNTRSGGGVSGKVIRKNEIIRKNIVAHLCSRVSFAGHNYVAVLEIAEPDVL